MLGQIASLLVDVVTSFFVYLLLARFHFQWLRAPFRNPVGEFVIAATNWMVVPARRVIPSLAGLDLATLILALLLQALALAVLYTIGGADFSAAPGTATAVLAGLAALDLVRLSLYILVFVVIVQAVMSWFTPYSPLASVFDALTRPFLRPLRRFVPPLGGVDVTPLVLLVALQVLLIPLAHLRQAVFGSLL
jgi:YggT family protein